MRTRRATTFWRIAAFGGCMLLLGLLVGGAAGMRARHFAAATFRPDDSPAVAALPDDPTPVELPLIPAATAPPVAPSVPAPSTPGDETAATTTATRVPAPGGTPTATVPPIGYAGTPLVARLRAGQPLALLLLGYGGPGHDGAYLTDSLEVARLETLSGKVLPSLYAILGA